MSELWQGKISEKWLHLNVKVLQAGEYIAMFDLLGS